MTHGRRIILLATLPIALTFAGCDGKSGLSRAKPDSGPPVSGIPDTALPGNPNPDTALPGNSNPDSAPPLRPSDAAIFDAIPVAPDTRPPKDGPGADLPAPAGTALIVVTPPSVDLGAVDVGATAGPVTVLVTNAGTTASGPLNVTVSGVGITASGCNGMVLAPNASCTLAITAQQTVAGPISGRVEVGDSAANTKKIAVSGISTGGPSVRLSLAPSPLDLGDVVTGLTAAGTIVMSNSTASNASGIAISVSGTGFSLSPAGTCTDTLAAGQSCNIVVGFSAGATSGPAKGYVNVTFGGVISSVAVTATVLTPAKLVMTPASASFVAVTGLPSTAATFYVTNVGDVPSTIPAVTIAGTNKDDFSFTTTCTVAMSGAATASCQITVVFVPKGPAGTSSSATLTVAESGSGGSSATATLTGTAVNQDTPANPVDRIPIDNTVSGWTIDADSNMDRSKKPMTASTMEQGISLIDGGMEPFYADGFTPKLFVWQNYKNAHLPAAPEGATLMLYVFQMPSAAQASGLYQSLLKFSPYQQAVWEEPTTPLLGTRSRIQDNGTQWRINFQKSECYVEITLYPSYGPAPDYDPGNLDLKKEALRFAQAVANRL